MKHQVTMMSTVEEFETCSFMLLFNLNYAVKNLIAKAFYLHLFLLMSSLHSSLHVNRGQLQFLGYKMYKRMLLKYYNYKILLKEKKRTVQDF